MSDRAPRLPSLLLLGLPKAHRQQIAGDLLEEYSAHAKPRYGPVAGRIWLWAQLIRCIFADLVQSRSRDVNPGPSAGRTRPSGAPSGSLAAPPRLRGNPMRELLQDLRYAARSLRLSPGFTTVVVLTLALAIGAGTTLFAIVNGVLLQPLPYDDPGSLVMLWERIPGRDVDFSTSIQSFRDWRRSTTSFDGLAALSPVSPVIYRDGRPERISGAAVSADYFRLLGVEPLLGRWFGSEDARPGATPVVILSHALWSQRFAADPEVIGKSLSLDGRAHQIVGVMGPEFWHFDPYGQTPPLLWIPEESRDWSGFARGDRVLRVVGRLRDGVSLEQARTELHSVANALAEAYPDDLEGWDLDAVPLHEEVVDDVEFGLLALFGPVGGLLLIGCANVANLLLVRTAARGNELAVRAMLGASRARLLRLHLAETLLLALSGGSLGLVLANWAAAAIVALTPTELPLAERIGVDTTVVAATLVASLVVGSALGVLPTLRFGRRPADGNTRAGNRTATDDRRGLRLRNTIVAVEVALSVVILSAAALMTQSYLRLSAVSPGFQVDNALTFNLELRPQSPNRDGEQAARFFEEIATALEQQPAVVAAGGTSHLPFSGWNMTDQVYRVDRATTTTADRMSVEMRRVTSGYLEAMRIPLLRGRGIASTDVPGSAPVVVVNEALARLVFDDEDPLGRWLGFGKGGAEERQIVGIVGGIKHYGLRDADQPVAYVPLSQYPTSWLRFVVRARNDPAALATAIRDTVARLDPDQPVTDFRSLDSLVASSVVFERYYTGVLGIFAFAALLLGAVGILGVVSFSVHRRVREVGIRVALGARPGGVVWLIVRQAMAPVGVGIAFGLAGSVAGNRLLGSLLYGVTTTDPITLIGVAACLLSVALASSWWPARRAARIDPLEALRSG